MNTQRVIFLLRRWWLVLVVGTLLAAGASYIVSKAQPKVYEATVLLQVNPGLPDVGGGGNFNEYQAAWTLAIQNARLLQTTEVAQATLTSTSGRLRYRLDTETLLKNTKATPLPQQALVTLAVRAADPDDAQLLANTIANVFVQSDALKRRADAPYLDYLNHQIRDRRNDAAVATHEQYQLQQKRVLSQAEVQRSGALTEQIADDGAQIGELQNAIQSIDLRLAGTGSTASIADFAQKPSSPIAPRTVINVLVAAVLALLVLLGIALLTDALDVRPRTPSDVADKLNLPLLATINSTTPSNPTVVKQSNQRSEVLEVDDYRLLVFNLHSATGVDAQTRPGRMLTIVGARSGDGATTVAANLAITAARTGLDVVLVDANFRNPTIQKLFDLPQRTGLTSLLRADNDSLSLLQETVTPNLRILTAGNAPIEAIDLLWSARMRRVLTTLRETADLVVLDVPEIRYPEAVTLASLSDAALLVANMRTKDRSALNTFMERLFLSKPTDSLLGIVVTLFATSTMLRYTPKPNTFRQRLGNIRGGIHRAD